MNARARGKRVHLLVVFAVLVALLAACGSGGQGATTSTAVGSIPSASTAPVVADGRPNILFVLTDDMRLDELRFMPNVRQLIAQQGITFDRFIDNVTECCPARASILRGQYAHNTGVLTNIGKDGGFQAAHAKGIEAQNMATALQDSGYTTGFFGKYLNGYPFTVSRSYVPPGWTHWASAIDGDPYSQYDYTLNEDGKEVPYGHDAASYGTDVYLGHTQRFIDAASKTGKPWFAYLSVYAPHFPSTPAPQDTQLFPNVKTSKAGAYDEADVSDKPAYVRNMPHLSQKAVDYADSTTRVRAQSLQAVDRGVAQLIAQLGAKNLLATTYVVFASDNGFHIGEHRLPGGKKTPYESDIRMPLLIRGPGIKPGAHVGALAGNIDLAPTFAEIAETALPYDPDGRSLTPFLQGALRVNNWRQSYLLSHWNAVFEGKTRADFGPNEASPEGSAPLDLIDPTIPRYQGLRTGRFTYVEYETGEVELYDLAKDPFQLNNIARSAGKGLLDVLHSLLESLKTCQGAQCRAIENLPPKPIKPKPKPKPKPAKPGQKQRAKQGAN